jgi:flagellin
MGLRINTNVASLTAQRNLSKTTDALVGNFSRLSTGRRIARASDDAAGLAISTRLQAQIRSLNQAGRNASDGIGLVQTAEGQLDELSSILTRARELSVQSANGTLQAIDKDALQNEFSNILTQVDQIANSAQFNGLPLLNAATSIRLQIGTGTTVGTDTLDISFASFLASSLGINTLNIGSTGNTTTAINALDAALDIVSAQRARIGAAQNTLNSAIASIANRSENLAAANSRILDVDLASETAELTKNNIIQQAGVAVLAQANTQPSSALALLRG